MNGPSNEMDDSKALVDRARNGDREAFAQMYRLYHRPVARMAAFYLNGAAEDAVAETFVRAWGSLGRYKDRGVPFSAWLYAIARHVIFDELRSRKKTVPRDSFPDIAIDGPNEDAAAIAASLHKLPDLQRRVIEMKYLLGMSNAEVGIVLGKSIGAVNALQWRALRALKDDLGSR